MTDQFASGTWKVTEGKADEFIERWTEFLQWARKTQPSLITVSLLRDTNDPRHFVSIAEWTDAASRKAWKDSDGFAEHFGAARALCDDMYGSDYERVVTI